jgi:hypothetical protein
MRTLKAGGTPTSRSSVSVGRITFAPIHAKEVVLFGSAVFHAWDLAEFSNVWITIFIKGIRAIAKELLIFIVIQKTRDAL